MEFLFNHAPVIGLVFFFSLFLGVAVWVLKPANKDAIEQHKYIPLSEESHERG